MAQRSSVALVLGSSKGLGNHLAQTLKAEGYFVLEAARSFDNTESENGVQFHCDLADINSVHSFLSHLQKYIKQKEITHFFWNAGVHVKGPFAEYSEAEILKLIDTNFKHPLLISRFIWAEMLKTPAPKTFVTIASTSGVKARIHETVYAATKWAQVGFTRSLGLENTHQAVRVALILPGGMRTELYSNAEEPADFQTFLDPQKVAEHILANVKKFEVAEWRQEAFELEIPRGSL